MQNEWGSPVLVILDAEAVAKDAFRLVNVWEYDSGAEELTAPSPEQCRSMLCDPEARAIPRMLL
jgi:hypothetical protein